MTSTSNPIPWLPLRALDGHKGDYGRALIVAGSRGMSGAAVLCSSAALRGGAGLVQVACPADVLPVVSAGNPCYMTVSIPQHADGTLSPAALDALRDPVKAATVLAIGPGLGHRDDVAALVMGLLELASDKPIILDADALNVLPRDPQRLPVRKAPLLLTPHPGEFARLLDVETKAVQANREALARDFAAAWKAILILKGRHTIVTDGHQMHSNDTGNPGMATGGTGDVLTGLLSGLLAQGLPAFDAAILGVWAHGRAGDLAAAELGQTALTAADVLEYLPYALKEREPEGLDSTAPPVL